MSMKIGLELKSERDQAIVNMLMEETMITTKTRILKLALQKASQDEDFIIKARKLSRFPSLDYFDAV